jgi:DNA-binding NarL/FixJ family response regulator
MTNEVKVLIVDDHPLVREGLAAHISAQPDMQVCGEAPDVDGALKLLDRTHPTLIVVDLTLKNGHGLDLIKKVSRIAPQTKILVVTAHDESLLAERALRAGAHGYVNKQEAQETVIDAARTVLRGGRYLSAEMTQRLLERAVAGPSRPGGIESLSDREIEIFELIGHGNSTRSIARQLHLSIHTIETHRENIRAKLNLRDGSELVRRAVQWVLETS